MSYRNYITTSYSKKIHSLTKQYQQGYLKSFQVKSPILSKKGKVLQEEYQMKLLKLARNEAKQRMYKSKSNIVIKKTQLSIDDYDTLITITDKKNIL